VSSTRGLLRQVFYERGIVALPGIDPIDPSTRLLGLAWAVEERQLTGCLVVE